jgi:hypothetical protein
LDVLDRAHGYFLHHSFLYDHGYACLGTHITDGRTPRFFEDFDDPGNTIFSRFAWKRIHPSGLDGIHGFDGVDRLADFRLLDVYRYALGVKGE